MTTAKNLTASQIGLSKDFPKTAKTEVKPKSAAGNSAEIRAQKVSGRKPTVGKTSRPGKPIGEVKINGDLEKSKRPLMVSDMDYKQIFVREGKLCMRVMNVCNANVKGKASKRSDLWIVNLSDGKTQLASDTPVELVDVEINIVNKKA